MLWGSLFALVFGASCALAQNDSYPFIGTWSSGSRAVVTGAGFANPANLTFFFPKTSGISYSFTNDGFYEIARYRFVANATNPACITGVMQWVHGTYTMNSTGSIICVPFLDGFEQVQDPCPSDPNRQSVIIDPSYNYTEIYKTWAVTQDPVKGPQLVLYQQDGSPLAPQTLLSTSPNMLPTTTLRNNSATAPGPTTSAGYVTQGKRSSGSWW